MSVIRSFAVGVRRRWANAIEAFLAFLGTLSIATELLAATFPGFSQSLQQGAASYWALALVGGVVVLAKELREPARVSFRLPGTPANITLRYGDILSWPDDMIVGVGEYFDHEIGQPVSSSSIHGQVIEQLFRGDQGRFRADVDQALESKKGVDNPKRSIEPKRRFPIGTLAVVPVGSRNLYLVALTETDTATHKASSSVPHLWVALTSALLGAATHGNGRPLALPLMGNGRSSLNIEPQHLLRLLILAIVECGKGTRLPNDVTVLLPLDCFEKLDILEIRDGWAVR